jgi:hypothetical protein
VTGKTWTVLITAVAQASPAATASLSLITTANQYIVHLPLILK